MHIVCTSPESKEQVVLNCSLHRPNFIIESGEHQNILVEGQYQNSFLNKCLHEPVSELDVLRYYNPSNTELDVTRVVDDAAASSKRGQY